MIELQRSDLTPRQRRTYDKLPRTSQIVYLAYGPKYKFSSNPVGELADLMFQPKERTQEFVDALWKRIENSLTPKV